MNSQIFFYDRSLNLIKEEVSAGKYRLSAVAVAETITQSVRILLMVSAYGCVFFMVGFDDSASAFLQFTALLWLAGLLVDSWGELELRKRDISYLF